MRKKAKGRPGAHHIESAHYEITGSTVARGTHLTELLLKEFKALTKTCLEAGVNPEQMKAILTEKIRGGRK